ncbi:MAG: hypothetical protein ABW170_10200 [Candidatus Thiodiazotropha sp. L084R]
MPKTKTEKPKSRLSMDQLEAFIAGSGQRADTLRADGFAALSNVKRAKLVQTRYEYARLVERHGEDDKLTSCVARKMSIEHGLLVASRSERARIEAPKIERSEETWQLHGYLRNKDGFARSRYTVGLYADAEGIEAPIVTAKTNSAGYFQLNLALPQQKPEPVPAKDSTAKNKPQVADRLSRHQTRYLGAQGGGKQALPFMDPRVLYPAPGVINYRDLIVHSEGDTGSQCNFASRLVGNSASRELHDTDNEKKGCRLAAIRPDHRVSFQDEAQAEKIGYDFCAYCFGKGRSKR